MPEYKLTQSKKDELEAELHELKGVQRTAILQRLEAARALGDLKENAEYHAMRDAQGKNESRIQSIEETLKHAVVVESSGNGVVDLASVVVIKKVDDASEYVYTIVSPQESDILENKIGEDSPIGEALMGKQEGDTITVETPKGAMVYTIIKVQ